MTEDDKFKITIRVADIPEFRLTIRRDEEENYRLAVKDVNKLWSNWKTVVKDNDSPTIIAVIALRFAKQFYETLAQLRKAEGENLRIDKNTNEVLENFEKELDKFLLDVK
ncbi:MAG: cell division protein ZapA [Muribaculaceae bacterium]